RQIAAQHEWRRPLLHAFRHVRHVRVAGERAPDARHRPGAGARRQALGVPRCRRHVRRLRHDHHDQPGLGERDDQPPRESTLPMKLLASVCCLLLIGCVAQGVRYCPAGLPVYDHVVIVVEENKDYEQIISNPAAPYLNRLAGEGALLTHMFGEEHNSEGNYFWLFSGDNHGVGFKDKVPTVKFGDGNLGTALLGRGLSFKGYSQSLPAIGSDIDVTPPGCHYPCLYGRKHVPWISFANVPDGPTPDTSSNL